MTRTYQCECGQAKRTASMPCMFCRETIDAQYRDQYWYELDTLEAANSVDDLKDWLQRNIKYILRP